ncbi:GntR family transcriptional regulator [Micromonospora wenchangensis]|uniref:GntR family transcriptional regulator n=1 Tax=Micromonospora wenchangensis TaxID=1185415 RepID=UPI003D7346A5
MTGRLPQETSFAPRYYLIEQELKSRIRSMQPHEPLPSEAALTEQFGVSRMTARAAVQRLVAEGLVYRQAGRGTFVAPPVAQRRADTLVRFSSEMRRQGRVPSSRVVSARLRPAEPGEVSRLRLAADAEVVAIQRVRLADGVPVALEQATFPPHVRDLLAVDLTDRSLHETLIRLGRVPMRGYATVEAHAAGEDDCRLLDVTPGTALLVENRLVLDQDDKPLELTQSRYVGARYSLEVAFSVDHDNSQTRPGPKA